jgi:YD repeat-containing protein
VKLKFIFIATLAMSSTQRANAGSSLDDYSMRTKGREIIDSIGPDMFGDQTNLQTGVTEFKVTDVSVKTNSGLLMSVGRKLDTNSNSTKMGIYGGSDYYDGVFSGEEPSKDIFGRHWELDVPYMKATFDARKGWVDSSLGVSFPEVGQAFKRCSVGGFTPPATIGVYPFYMAYFQPHEYWNGTQINIPGREEANLLRISNAPVLGADGTNYYGTTKSNWRVSCLPQLKNATGEGFMVVLPNGTKYYFDWMARHRRPSTMSSPVSTTTYVPGSGSPYGNNGYIAYDYQAPKVVLPREDVYLYVTKVEDRFGNWLNYSYDAANPMRLLSIASNEGSSINLAYSALGRVSSVTAGSQTWSYIYKQVGNTSSTIYELNEVVLPDNSRWSYEGVANLSFVNISDDELWKNCVLNIKDNSSAQPTTVYNSLPIKIKHPSGAIGTFVIRRLVHGMNRQPGGCNVGIGGGVKMENGPSAFQLPSLVEKKIEGSGIQAQMWSYFYTPSWSWASACTALNPCATTSLTTITGPNGVKTKYKFGNDYPNNAGQLIEVSVEKDGNVFQKINNTYLTTLANQVFPDSNGIDPNLGNNPFSSKNRPSISNVITQDAVSFSQKSNSFDEFVNPTSTTKSNSLGHTRTDAIVYENNLNKWVLGQVKSVTNTNTSPNVIVSQTTYDTTTALPLQTYNNGQLQVTMTYNADGTLATVKDANNSMVSLSSYKRGTAQAIALPDGKLLSGVVNDNGWLTSTTDQLGNAMSYGYDSMGRLSNVTYPLADSTLWNPQTLNFAVATTAAYGLPVGHWYQTASTGNGKVTTYYDAMWRPVLLVTEDTANTTTRSFVVNRYDTSGRLAFSSYPVASLTSVNDVLTGNYTEYDALGRVTKVKQDSEQGLLISTTEYLTGFKTKVTNPRGYSTTTSYQVFDTPDTSRPVLIQSPENVTTTITRDVFGKPLSVTRTGPEG